MDNIQKAKKKIVKFIHYIPVDFIGFFCLEFLKTGKMCSDFLGDLLILNVFFLPEKQTRCAKFRSRIHKGRTQFDSCQSGCCQNDRPERI